MSAPARDPLPRYSVHADATNIFAFLKDSFFKMPRPVQVIGWLVFLLLFVFLVLYPLLGITYYEGRVVYITIGQEKKPQMAAAPGIKIQKGASTITNEEGEFTMGVRMPNIPFVDVDFDFTYEKQTETVSLPMPGPFISLFNPNPRKIYYVPASNVPHKSGLYIKHYFLNEVEARDALNKSLVGASPGGNGSSPSEPLSARSRSGTGISMIGTVYAAGPALNKRNYTLWLEELRIPGRNSSAEVYFDARIDGRSMHFDSLPDAKSPESRDLTVYGDTPVRFDALTIPLPQETHRVEIAMFERKSFWEKNTLLGTVGFDISPDKVSKEMTLSDSNVQATLKLLPAVALACTTATEQGGKNIYGLLWLDIDKNDLAKINAVQYDLGPGFERRKVSTPEIQPSTFYASGVSLLVSQPMKGKVDFLQGGTAFLSTVCDRETKTADTALEHYFLGRAYYMAGRIDDALRELRLSRSLDATFVPAIMSEGTVWGKKGNAEAALADFENAVHLSPNDPQVLNGYAWLVADQLPHPQLLQLQEARKRAERAVEISPEPNFLDTLGWVQHKLGENDDALKTLKRALDIQALRSNSSSVWQALQYHLGHVYGALGKKAEARQAFQKVLDYGQKYAIYNVAYVQTAQAELQKLR
jgi:tetratricopeptide (TPR) repeat protein